MMTKSRKFLSLLGALCALSPHVARAADQLTYISDDREVSFLGGVGYTWLKADEVVYNNDGSRLSQLFWKTRAPVLTGSVRAEFAPQWKIVGNAVFGFAGTSQMKDYDWFGPFFRSYDFDDWTHRSISDASLDRYLNIDAAIGRDFELTDEAVVNLHAGLKYTNVKWTAYGGSYVYSRNGFRQDTGDFGAGVRGISYEQRFPGLFVGAETTVKSGRLSFTGLLRGGVSVNASDTDHHWMRSLRFEETFSAVPFVSLGAKVDYAMTETIGLFVSAAYDAYFRTKGDTTMHDIATGEQYPTDGKDGAGLDFQSFTISTGLRMAF